MKRSRNILQDGKVGKEGVELKSPADAKGSHLVRFPVGDILPIKDDLTPGGRIDPGDEVEKGGLARPVGSNQSYNLTLINKGVKVVNG